MSVKEKATDLKNKLFKSCKGVTKLWPEQTTEPPETAEPIFFLEKKGTKRNKKQKDINTVRKFVFWFKEDCFERRIYFNCPRRPTLIVATFIVRG